MLSSLHPHRCCDRSNTYKCLLCEISGLDSKAFKEILYMILHNRKQMSLRHHPASCGNVISTKKNVKSIYQCTVTSVFAEFCEHPHTPLILFLFFLLSSEKHNNCKVNSRELAHAHENTKEKKRKIHKKRV